MKDARTIQHWDFDQTLREFGFYSLGSEACGLGMRRLYDLDEQAVELVTEFLGGAVPTAPNRNPYGIKSMFIPHIMVRYLLAYALTAEWPFVFDVSHDDGSFRANYLLCCTEERREQVIEVLGRTKTPYHLWRRQGTHRGGASNQHAMWGYVP